ncbi:copper transport protein ATX1 [Cryptomeria japonica]|uniref:copper transport protein ATX1 n=1 Tax=Cryptomeria japonica TaxID=3369 RepID=UPI0025AC620F|nr:copper transport protein ATX1 [Cryptomeria japonica]
MQEEMRTIVMKVNIDCQGCHDRMQRALLKIDGMNGFQIESNKVTANVKGNTDSDKIIRRLSRKTGKNVQKLKEEKKSEEKSANKELYPHDHAKYFTSLSDEDVNCTIM